MATYNGEYITTEKENQMLPHLFKDRKSPSPMQNNDAEQKKVLAAISLTGDPEEARRIAGMRNKVAFYETLDKLAMRKEYQAVLMKMGVSFEYLVGNIKAIIDKEDANDFAKLAAVNTFMKSLGVDKNDIDAPPTSGWEDELLKVADKNKALPPSTNVDGSGVVIGDYEVHEPPVPESIRKVREREQKEADELFG